MDELMRGPYSPGYFFFFIFLAAFLLAIIQLEIITFIFEKLGLSKQGAMWLLLISLVGSFVNLPLFSVRNNVTYRDINLFWYRLFGLNAMPDFTRTVVAVNVGGCVVPVFFSLYLLFSLGIPAMDILLATGIVTGISYAVSRPVEGMGITMPALVAPITAALTAMSMNPGLSAPLAYIAGTLGVLIGADLLRLHAIKRFNTPLASIGGAGTFDGIFITGVIAVLLTHLSP